MLESQLRYAQSLKQLDRAERVIPLGAQTVSKSKLTLPPGIAPLYASHAEGCRIWDVDGNEYIDLVSGLAAVNLGYADAEIGQAVIDQVPRGITISLAHPIEAEVAELIVDIVPSAEMVRFGKNGSDATSAAIRVARGYTGRDHVIVCGYHGWHDWYIGTAPTRNLGVPSDVANLAHSVPFNDLAAMEAELKKNPTAAIIMEVMTLEWPEPGYLEGVRALADEYGAILVFDEMVTGFRFANGGAQEYFGVTPDLSTFGKGMANGYPLSAIVGKREYMMVLEKAFFTGTFGGELLSLTAAKVVLERIKNTSVISDICDTGQRLTDLVTSVISEVGAEDVVSLVGHPAWKFLVWNPSLGGQLADLKILFMQEMSKRGVLMIATHNVMAAHDEKALQTVAQAYRETLPIILDALEKGDAHARLDVEVGELGPRVR
jgi:glutamate-1-semialdehyde 2,1-aminomutase